MRDQIVKAFADANIQLPNTITDALSDEALAEQAEKFYRKTNIESASTMRRDMKIDYKRRLGDIALARIAKELGIKDQELVEARINERAVFLNELRSHDALVRMIQKIGIACGVYKPTAEGAPFSTSEALQLGIALQSIFGSLFTNASDAGGRIRALEAQVDHLHLKNEQLGNEVNRGKRDMFDLGEEASLRATVIEGTEDPYFHLYAEDLEGNIGWITWDSNQYPLIFNVGDELPEVRRIRIRTFSRKTAQFPTLEAAQELRDWLSARPIFKSRIGDPHSLRIARFVAEEVE